MIKKQAAEIVMGIFVLLMFVLMFASPYGAIIAAAGFGLFILFVFFTELGSEDEEDGEKSAHACKETKRYSRYVGREKDKIEMKEVFGSKNEKFQGVGMKKESRDRKKEVLTETKGTHRKTA